MTGHYKVSDNDLVIHKDKLYISDNIIQTKNEERDFVIRSFCINFSIINRIARRYLRGIPIDVRTKIMNIQEKGANGKYFETQHLVIIKPKDNLRDMVRTFYHEMTHAFQFASQKLQILNVQNDVWDMCWVRRKTGIRVSEGRPMTMQEYQNQPHEIHARKRAEDLISHTDRQYPELLK